MLRQLSLNRFNLVNVTSQHRVPNNTTVFKNMSDDIQNALDSKPLSCDLKHFKINLARKAVLDTVYGQPDLQVASMHRPSENASWKAISESWKKRTWKLLS